MSAYAAAAAAGDLSWAAAVAVSGQFAEDVVLVTQDKQTIHGRQAVVKRLNKGADNIVLRHSCSLTHSLSKYCVAPDQARLELAGMELISKLHDGGAGGQPAKFETTEPEPQAQATNNWVVITTFNRGLMSFKIKNEFQFNADHKITRLQSKRC